MIEMDIRKLNSATKYPSILTYHETGDRGCLKDVVQVPFSAGGPIYLTEKVDGTNARVVILPASAPIIHGGTTRRYLIGSREEFLFAHGDLIFDKQYGVKEALEPVAEALPAQPDRITVFFFEVYGGDLPASKQYTSSKAVSLRLFDVARVPQDVLDQPVERISSWREHGGQEFLIEKDLEAQVNALTDQGLNVFRVPRLGSVDSLPTTVEDTYEWLKSHEKSRCDLGGGKGNSEGVVARTADRKAIAKFRFEDYEKTLGIKRTK